MRELLENMIPIFFYFFLSFSKLWINPGFGGSFDGDNADFCLPSLLLHEALRFKQTKQRVDPKVLKSCWKSLKKSHFATLFSENCQHGNEFIAGF